MHPILFWWRGEPYATYDLLVPLGYVTGVLWLRTQLKHHGAKPAELWGLILTVLAGALLGGKLGFFIVEWHDFLADPWSMIRDWNTGWVFWFGLLMGIAAGSAYQWWHNRHYRPRAYLPVADYCVTALAIGHIFGRFGCLAEGCCHGRPTTMPWGIVFTDPACSVMDSLKGIPLHPTQLYEAFGEALAAAFLIYVVLPGIRAGKYRYGTAFYGYLLYYSFLRFLGECFRGDDRGVFLSPILSPSQWTSVFSAIVVGVILWKRGVIERDPAGRSLFTDRA
ncbi:MAG: prolipoprotein diacylglyceryl transferase [Elusimicrobia bacterium]|nr:prolipoprotein diacylglyceryl transferase [Elusimicrobiota bacterium]